MEEYTINLLDKTNPLEIESYEKAMFEAFKGVVDSSLESIWNFDFTGKKIKTKIPYCYQEIMTAQINGSVVAASAVNFNMQIKLQLEMFGFSINKSEKRICEALHLFNNHLEINSQLLLPHFKTHLFEYLVSQDIKRVYGTCSQKRIRSYRILGFQDIDQRIFNGQKKYLLTIDI